MIYKRDTLILKKIVNEISCKCIQNFSNCTERQSACIFEDIYRWCHSKFHSIQTRYVPNEIIFVDDAVNYAYNCQWMYGEYFLEAEDFNPQDSKDFCEKNIKQNISDLQIFQTILYILNTEHSAFIIKKKINNFLHFDIC